MTKTFDEHVRDDPILRSALTKAMDDSGMRLVLRVLRLRSGRDARDVTTDPFALAMDVGWKNVGRELDVAMRSVNPAGYATLLGEQDSDDAARALEPN